VRLNARIAEFVWDRRRLLALACAVVTVLALWQARAVGVDNSLRIWFVDDDPTLVAYRSFQARFGNDEVVVVALERADGMASDAGLRLLERAQARLAQVDGVAQVLSIADYAELLRGLGVEGDLRERVLTEDALRDRLISRDGRFAAMVLRLQTGEDIDARRDRVLAGIEQALDRLGEPHHLAGVGVLYVALNRLSMIDAFTLFCAAVALMFVLLWAVYRRLTPALITLGVAATAMLWTMGLYGAAGRSLNMVTSAMPTVILVVGVAQMIHILLFAARQPQRAERRARAVAVIGEMLPPALLTIATSAFGFAALAASPLPAVRDLGMFTAAGLLGCFALCLLGSAFVLASARREPRPREDGWMPRAALRLGALGARHPLRTLAAAGFAVLVAGAAGSRVAVDTFTLEYLPADHPVRRDSALIEERLGPYVPLEFLVTPPAGPARADLPAAIERWQRAGERVAGVGWSRSPVDDARAGFVLEPRIGPEGALRVTFSVRMQSARGVDRTTKALLALARLPQGSRVEPAGYLPLYVHMVDQIVASQLSGFALAFVAVFGAIALAFRSARIAALALPSNLLPLLVIFGAMGAAGIRLDPATVTIAAIVLGLIVDDTVHLLYRLRTELARQDAGADRAAALRTTMGSAGRAIVATTLVMTLGFSVFAFSEIRSLVTFGLLIALAMLSGLLADLVLVPALVMLRVWRRPC